MKNNLLLISIICLGGIISACKKEGNMTPLLPPSSFTFSAGDSLITGQFEDTSARKESISIRIFGDTTGKFHGDSLLVTYVSGSGKQYYNTKDDDNFVTVDKYVKKYNGAVSGSFHVKVANGAESILLQQGIFTALYQE